VYGLDSSLSWSEELAAAYLLGLGHIHRCQRRYAAQEAHLVEILVALMPRALRRVGRSF